MTKNSVNQLAAYFGNNPKATIRKGGYLGLFERFSLQGKVGTQKCSKINWNQVLFEKSQSRGVAAACEHNLKKNECSLS